MYVSSTASPHPAQPAAATPLARMASSGLWCWRFINVIDCNVWSPGTYRDIDGLTHFVIKTLQIRNGDSGHLDEAAPVDRFDLEDRAEGDDFAGFLVGTAAKSGSCTEDSLEDEHGSLSLSGG